MNKVVNQQLAAFASLLGPLSPFTKAVVPAALSLAVAIANSLFAGSIDATSVTVAASGLGLAAVAYLLPNVEHKKATPAAPAAPVAPVVPTTPAPKA